jgi:hypothetical protein
LPVVEKVWKGLKTVILPDVHVGLSRIKQMNITSHIQENDQQENET